MKIKITTLDSSAINWHAVGKDRVVQNIINLMSIVQYEIAYNRTVGIPTELTDMPSTKLAEKYQSALVELIEDNEPRAMVESVHCLGVSEDGQITFEVVLDIVI